MTQDEIMSLWNEHADGMNGDTIMRFANAVAAKYEQKIQDLEDLITELQERQA